MPWSQTTPMHQRTLFIADHLRGTRSVTELCAEYGISRKTGYKWIDRYIRRGPAGLEDRSRRPRTAPNATARAGRRRADLTLRHRHPTLGRQEAARGAGASAIRTGRCRAAPPPATAQAPRPGPRTTPARRAIGHPGKPTSLILAPNQVWCADFKGQFRMGNGRYCYPLTVTDGFSRFLLGCHGLPTPPSAGAKPVFQRLFQEYGLPQCIRTDNGVPFATNTLARLRRLSAWWVRLGVLPQLIEPGNPQQNGRHERMHRTLKAEATRPPAASHALAAAQVRSLPPGVQPRATARGARAADAGRALRHSHAPMPDKLPPLEYPDRFEVRYVSANGGIRWNSNGSTSPPPASASTSAWKRSTMGSGTCTSAPLRLGRLLERTMKIEDAYGRLYRHR